jgi:hypothetical protein
MELITVISTGLGATKTGLELINAFLKRTKDGALKPADVEDCLRQLHDNMWEAKRALQVADDENQKLRRRIEEHERQAAIGNDLQWEADGGFWIRKSEAEKGVCIRYCPTCYGEKRLLIPLTEAMTAGMFSCPNHGGTPHPTKSYRTRDEEQIRKMNADNNAADITDRY